MTAYRVDSEIFARMPEVCFGVVVARGARQPKPGSVAAEAIAVRLTEAIESVRNRFGGTAVKSHPDIVPYRKAFQCLGFNPNRFPSSIEAMVGRIAKVGGLPSVGLGINRVMICSRASTPTPVRPEVKQTGTR